VIGETCEFVEQVSLDGTEWELGTRHNHRHVAGAQLAVRQLIDDAGAGRGVRRGARCDPDDER